MMKNSWYQAKVIRGKKIGKSLGFPTLNLDTPSILKGSKEGVYAARLKIGNKLYKGILYYGPRLLLGETVKILEIFVFDFDKDIYGETISFQVRKFIRKVKNFPNSKSFQKQLLLDCQKAKDLLK